MSWVPILPSRISLGYSEAIFLFEFNRHSFSTYCVHPGGGEQGKLEPDLNLKNFWGTNGYIHTLTDMSRHFFQLKAPIIK